jgi:hypothetical protein
MDFRSTERLMDCAYHEAGHVLVARHFGQRANARVWRKRNGHWTGFAFVPDVHRGPADQRRMIALAGAAGQSRGRGWTLEPGFISKADWDLYKYRDPNPDDPEIYPAEVWQVMDIIDSDAFIDIAKDLLK